jgi:hypothetical protein
MALERCSRLRADHSSQLGARTENFTAESAESAEREKKEKEKSLRSPRSLRFKFLDAEAKTPTCDES